MSENPEDTDRAKPENLPEEESDLVDSSEEIIEDENQKSGVDPLVALRQDMLEEEDQPEINSKPDLLQRMTGTSSTRKGPIKTRPATTREQNFGIVTNRHLPPPEPTFRKSQPINEEIRDDFLEMRLGTGPFNGIKSDSQSELKAETPIHIEGDPKAEGGLFSQSSSLPVSQTDSLSESRGRKPLDPLWDDAENEDEENQEYSSEKSQELASHPVDDRKMLGSGAERQYQVNKYLLYNPKSNLFTKFKDLSSIEKTLLIGLVLAVIIVSALIMYLFLDSRRVEIPQLGSLSSPTQTQISPTAEKLPIPSGIKLPGGWNFQLKQGALVNGKWSPDTSEWLSGTEIRKVIALPWNKQLEAVINSFEPNNLIELYMNNGDKLTYKVQAVSQVPLSDSTVMVDTRPSLAVILINPDSEYRWVVVAYP